MLMLPAPRAMIALLMLSLCLPALATTVTVTDPAGQSLATVMVRERRADGALRSHA